MGTFQEVEEQEQVVGYPEALRTELAAAECGVQYGDDPQLL